MSTLSDEDFKIFEAEIHRLQKEISGIDVLIDRSPIFRAFSNVIPDWYADDIKVLRDVVTPYLESEVGKFNMGGAFISEAYEPWSIHSDDTPYYKAMSAFNNAETFVVCIIPLETVNSHSIVFNEAFEFSLNYYKECHEPLCELRDIDEELYQKYLTHCDRDDLRYLTLQSINKWEKGRLMVFDRKLLHCSDNYLANGVSCKSSLIMWTEKPV